MQMLTVGGLDVHLELRGMRCLDRVFRIRRHASRFMRADEGLDSIELVSCQELRPTNCKVEQAHRCLDI